MRAEKDAIEEVADRQVKRLKDDLQKVRADLSSMTQLYVELNNTKATESVNATASRLLLKCRANFKKAQKVCYNKLDKCEQEMEDEEEETKKLIKALNAQHKDKLEDQEKGHTAEVKDLKA